MLYVSSSSILMREWCNVVCHFQVVTSLREVEILCRRFNERFEETASRTERMRLLLDEPDATRDPTPGFAALYRLAKASPAQLGSLASYSTSLEVDGIQYALHSVIGNGGAAKVYKATRDGRECVIKLAEAGRIRAEANALTQLSALELPCVAALVAHRTALNPACLVLEPVGTPLNAVLQEAGFMELADCMSVGRKVLQALAQLHRAGFIHCDIHPGNVITCGADQRVVLIDWENAHRLVDVLPRTELLGTPAYLCDDFLKAHGAQKAYTLSQRDDLFGLAYTLLSLSAGYLPWAKLTKPADIIACRSGSAVPSWFAAFVAGLASSAIDYDSLARCLQAEAVPAKTICDVIISSGPRKGRKCRRALPDCQYHGKDPTRKDSE